MSKNLVIVESPAKAKTIKKYLGNDFSVLASYGHVRDLLPKEGAVDPEHDFAMKYQAIEKNEKHLDAIAKAIGKADALYLATDPDREGEAISWHLCEHLKEKQLLKEKRCSAWCSTRSPNEPFKRRWSIRVSCRWSLSTRSRRGARWITSWDSFSRHSCGRRCVLASRRGACRARRCA